MGMRGGRPSRKRLRELERDVERARQRRLAARAVGDRAVGRHAEPAGARFGVGRHTRERPDSADPR